MKTIAPLQKTNLVKSFSLLLMIFFLLWGLTSYFLLGVVYISTPWVILTVILSAFFGWRLYKARYHTVFSYDQNRFDLQVGRKRQAAHWGEYDRVSLFHFGFGEFAVRLYNDDGKYIEIPVSALKLDPSRFRFEAMEMVRGQRQKRPATVGQT